MLVCYASVVVEAKTLMFVVAIVLLCSNVSVGLVAVV